MSTYLSNAACGCPACDDGVQPGHFACSQADAKLVQEEAAGEVVRFFDGTSWRWERTSRESRLARDRREFYANR